MPLAVLDSTLAQHLLTQLRDEQTPPERFRPLARRIATLVIAEATRGLPARPKEVNTPLEPFTGAEIGAPVVLVPILRAGLGMLEAAQELLPEASVGYIGLERDEETALAKSYYCKLPNLQGAAVLILDPMLATGGSAEWAVQQAQMQGAQYIALLCVVAAPEGVQRLSENFPNLHIVTAALDRALNDRKYILPGLGDFGDRLFGT